MNVFFGPIFNPRCFKTKLSDKRSKWQNLLGPKGPPKGVVSGGWEESSGRLEVGLVFWGSCYH